MTSRLAIVTGGSTGIGRHLVTALCRAGYAVAFSYRGSVSAAESLLAELSTAPVIGLESDVGVKGEVDSFFEKIVEWHGESPQLLVNNAGVQTWSPLLELEENCWDDVIQTNLKGCFLNTQTAGRLMATSGRGGRIINIGSGCNKLGFPRLVDYTASKGGIEQFTKVAASELGPFGITVNCVAPGSIITDRTNAEAPDYAAAWSPITPMRRIGTPADVANAVLFFAADATNFITGQTLWVDGGVFSQAPWPYPL